MKPFNAKPLFVLSVIVLLFTVSLRAKADDPAAKPEQAPVIEPLPITVVPGSDDTFLFVAGERRDPFTFTKAYPKTSAPRPDDAKTVAVVDPTRLDPAQIAAKRDEMLVLLAQGEQFLMDDHGQEAVAACDRGFDVVKDIRVNDYRELLAPRDALARLHKAATRRKNRDAAERDFSIINMHLSGVIVSQKMPRAIVNGHIVTMGDTIKAGDEDCPLFSIARDQITVIFRNYRMSVQVEK